MSGLTDERRMMIEWHCKKLVDRYNLLNDSGDWTAAAECFAPGGTYKVPGDERLFSGRAQIAVALAQRPAWTFRHYVTNAVVDAISPVEARGRSYLLIAFDGDAGGQGTIGPALTGEVEEHFVLTDEGWRFGDRRGLPGIPFGTRAA